MRNAGSTKCLDMGQVTGDLARGLVIPQISASCDSICCAQAAGLILMFILTMKLGESCS